MRAELTFEFDWESETDSGSDALYASDQNETNAKLETLIEEQRQFDETFSAWFY